MVTRSTMATAGPSSMTTCAVMMRSSGINSTPRGPEHQRDPLAEFILNRDAVLMRVLESGRHVHQVAVTDLQPLGLAADRPDAERTGRAERQHGLLVERGVGVPVAPGPVAVGLEGGVGEPDAEFCFQ